MQFRVTRLIFPFTCIAWGLSGVAGNVFAEPSPLPSPTLPGIRIKEPASDAEKKEGDTYNFYFQKSPSTNKVEQTGDGQAIESSDATAVPEPRSRNESFGRSTIREKTANLFAGLTVLPGQSTSGLNLGCELLPQSALGIRLEIFEASGASGSDGSSSFSAYGSTDVSRERHVLGGGAALTLNIVHKSAMKISPLIGFMAMNAKDSTSTHQFSAYGDQADTSASDRFKILPYAGLSGSLSIGESFGVIAGLQVPIDPKFVTFSVGLFLNL